MGIRGGNETLCPKDIDYWGKLPCVFDNNMLQCHTDGHVAGKFKAFALPNGKVGVEFTFDKVDKIPATIQLVFHWGRVYNEVKQAKEGQMGRSLTVPKFSRKKEG